MKIKPVGYRVLVEIEEDPTVKAARKSGIIIVEDADSADRNMQDKGIVRAFGPLAFSDKGGTAKHCKIGDTVLYAKHGGHKVDFPGYELSENGFLKLINDEDIFATVEE